MCICVQVHMPERAYMEAWGKCWVSSSITSHLFFLKPICYLCMYFMCVGTRVLPHSCGCQKKIFRGQFFPSILLSQGLSSFCCCTVNSRIAGKRFSKEFCPERPSHHRSSGMTDGHCHIGLFLKAGFWVWPPCEACVTAFTCRVVSLASHCFLSHRVF